MQRDVYRSTCNKRLIRNPVGADRSADAWPPVRAGDLRYQDIRAPELRMLNLTAAQREMVQFYENLYSNS
ncbi:unnamed protein product [Plutella xylostella]|uniref:(diamondback moth) hypothetical protein n=1 Tax=Plutella xylostella TaxID=51655 RepID=A0A8S4FL42_PLUXY|nr:unnamed protein product [Plutella xylostella]